MRWVTIRFVLLVGVLGATGACTPIETTPAKSPLAPPRMSQDSVVLDIFFVRVPFGDPEANGSLWDEIDEQHFPTELRRELATNGFRAGTVGVHVPEAILRQLQLDEDSMSAEQATEVSPTDLASTPTVTRRHKQLRVGKPCEIQTSEIYDELPVVMCHDGELCGRSYQDAQTILVFKAFPEPDGRVRFEIAPQLHYGTPKGRYMSTGGAVRLDFGRDRRVFDKLTMHAQLRNGEMIVMGSLDHRLGSLGHHFFTQRSEGPLEQKLLVIRLSQINQDPLFGPDALLPLGDGSIDSLNANTVE